MGNCVWEITGQKDNGTGNCVNTSTANSTTITPTTNATYSTHTLHAALHAPPVSWPSQGPEAAKRHRLVPVSPPYPYPL